jgi:flagellar basal body rod protein FlgB
MELVELFETYVRLDIDGGRPALYKLVHSDKHIFEKQEVDEDPFVSVRAAAPPALAGRQQLRSARDPDAERTHRADARRARPYGHYDQSALAGAQRHRNEPEGAARQPQGGIVNVRRQDGIMPLQYPNLNPFVFETLQMLKDNKEENTGMSSLSQGLNKDAISSQNSQGLVEGLVTLSQVRQKVIARNFANVLGELYRKVRKLSIEFVSREQIASIVDEFAGVDPKLWRPERPVKVSLNVGYGEQEKEAAKYAALWGLLTKDPVASLWCAPPKQHKLLADGMRKNGFANYADYIISPEEWKAPPPDALKKQELDAKTTAAQAALTSAQAMQQKVEVAAQYDAIKAHLAQMQQTLKHMVDLRAADRQDLDTSNRVDVSQREMHLLEIAPPAAEKAIVSP